MYLSGIDFVQFGLDRVTLARHLEFGKNGERLLKLMPLGLLVALLPRQQSPLPITVAQTVLLAQLQADRFLLLVQRQPLLQPAPHVQDVCMVAVAILQTVLVAQLQADRFLLLVQRQRLLQPPPRLHDQRLVAVADLQHVERFTVAVPRVKGFFLLQNAEGLFQLTDPQRHRTPAVTKPALTCAFLSLPKELGGWNDLGQALATITPARLPIFEQPLQGGSVRLVQVAEFPCAATRPHLLPQKC